MAEVVELRNRRAPIYDRRTGKRIAWLRKLWNGPRPVYKPNYMQQSCLALGWTEYVYTKDGSFLSDIEARRAYGTSDAAKDHGWRSEYHHRLTPKGRAVIAGDEHWEAKHPAPVVQAPLAPLPDPPRAPEPAPAPQPVAAEPNETWWEVLIEPDAPPPQPTQKAVRLGEMLRCAEREVDMRRAVYPKMVGKGRMTQSRADAEITLMKDIAAYLRRDLEAP